MMRVPLAGQTVDAFVAGRIEHAPLTEAAFSDFYARTAGPLGGYLRRLTGDASLAEDLTQEAYVRFLSLLRVPDTEDHRRNYLFRIGTNLARDHFRHKQRDYAYRVSVCMEARAPSRSHDLGAMQRGGDLQPVLELLSPRDRELLLLAYVEGMTHQEISAITGLMRASLKPLLFRARRRFARALRDAGITASVSAEAR